MLYAELNENGVFVRERSTPAPLPVIPRWIDGKRVNKEPQDETGKALWDKAPFVLFPLVLVETPLDPANYKPDGFEYRLEADGTVSKIGRVLPLTDEEKQHFAVWNAKETRKAALPDYDELMELVVTALKVVLDRQLMTEVKADPRTRVSISKAGYNRLLSVVKALRATPLLDHVAIDQPTGGITPDLQPANARDAQVSIFNDRVEKVMGDATVPAALKDALSTLRKLV
jgi:hypothetical protein